jgi:hypothetical protein
MNPLRRRRLGGGKSYPMLGAAFSGGSSHLMGIADNPALSMGAGARLTIAAWLLPTSFAVTSAFVSKAGAVTAAGLEYLVQVNTSGVCQMRVSDGAAVVSAGLTIALNTWNFIVARYDGATVGVSLNGGAFGASAFTTDIQDSTNAFRLGLTSAGTLPYTGTIDAVGVWKRALTASEITQLYNGGVGMAYQDLSGALFTNLIAWYDLDDPGGSGATWVDKAGSNPLIAGAGAAAPTSAPGKR